MDVQWHVAAIPGLVSGILSIALAWFVYSTRPTRTQNRFLAIFLFSTGLAWFLHKGVVPLVGAESSARAGVIAFLFIHWIAHLFHFLFVTTLDSSISRIFARTWIRWTAAVLMMGAAFSSFLVEGWAGTAVPSAVHGGWWGTPGPLYAMAAPVFIVLFLYGFAAGYLAWRGSRGDTDRRQNGAYFLAFAVHDGGMALMLIMAAAAGPMLGAPLIEHLFHWIPPLVNIWLVVLLSYGILTTQLFDIDVKARLAISRSSVAAVFAAVFLVVSETVEQFLPIDGALPGIAAAVGVALVIRPLQRLTEALAARILPVAPDQEAHLRTRRLEVYRTALDGALRDGTMTAKERSGLLQLQQELGLTQAEAGTLDKPRRRT